ncbi:rRNA processing/ribosome biogenesis-domain-containing protein [Xylogone sp. PMI_703]|nr:rRNA processing/ribosome biogenesis-domain-containing protein [Xylogone sp. PMI_703]
MSCPELRNLCFKLSSTQTADLPRHIPALLRHVWNCHASLSVISGNAVKSDASKSAVLVHELKTRLTALLNGRSPEGRFAAVALIKGVVDVAGWSILQDQKVSENWVPGLLGLLRKPGPLVSKELCILTLTKIYVMTQPYPSLIRAITTPTLKTFVECCLQLVSSKGSGQVKNVPQSLTETVFRSLFELVQCYTTTFRPYALDIRMAVLPYLAPTCTDAVFVSSSLKQSACQLLISLHHTASPVKQAGNEAKNAGSEEWAIAVRDLLNIIHVTADQVFRSVIEDWESECGYIPSSVDVDQDPFGGSDSLEALQRWKGAAAGLFDNLPTWTSIDSGVERLTGLLELLNDYFKVDSPGAVSIPLGIILDMIIRILSIDLPSSQGYASGRGNARLNPSISREEVDSLCCSLPRIYIAALQVVSTLSDRFQSGLLATARAILDQMVWIFPSGKSSPDFRLVIYICIEKILPLVGRSLERPAINRLATIMRSCCEDAQGMVGNPGSHTTTDSNTGNRGGSNGVALNPDTILRNVTNTTSNHTIVNPDLTAAAQALLPVFFSYLPQYQLHNSLRSELERAAIMSATQEAMLAAILNPYLAKNGRSFPSLLPHLCRLTDDTNLTEVLLRPRMPLVPSASGTKLAETIDNEALVGTPLDPLGVQSEPELLMPSRPEASNRAGLGPSEAISHIETLSKSTEFTGSLSVDHAGTDHSVVQSQGSLVTAKLPALPELPEEREAMVTSATSAVPMVDVHMGESAQDDDSDDESVHLTMQLDTDSDSE